jgi:hypothetical protein
VEAHERGQVEVGEHVAVQGEESLLQMRRGEPDRAGGAARLRLRDPGETGTAGLTVAEDLPKGVGQEAAGEDDLLDTVAVEPLDQVGEEGAVHQRQDRLRDRLGQRAQPRPLPAYQDDRLH